MDEIIEKLRWFFILFYFIHVLFWCSFPCLHLLLSYFWRWLASSGFPLPTFPSRGCCVGSWHVVCPWGYPICFLLEGGGGLWTDAAIMPVFSSLYLSRYFPAHLGSRIWEKVRCHRCAFKANRTDCQTQLSWETLFHWRCPYSKYFLELPWESGACSDQSYWYYICPQAYSVQREPVNVCGQVRSQVQSTGTD